ncbi:hypothetical protein Ddye_016030 [Dipteronia dyeriana]|uniref:Polygalacturonase n=1 Tax=Dipteronia dyeriana TaxID=168575 RepID=A0AAD9WZ30_9ROSI|nr:hypothetical protein Ddye_016030 [Dipteronia dyeriana]
MRKLNIAAIFLMMLFASTAQAHPIVFDVRKYGVTADGVTDFSKALLDAFRDACASPTPSKVWVPKGKFALKQVILQGPCKAPIHVKIEGNIKALTELGTTNAGSSWIAFQYMSNFTLSGGAIFDGQGPKAWGTCGKNTYCKKLPIVSS